MALIRSPSGSSTAAYALAVGLAIVPAHAQDNPGPQPRPAPSTQTLSDDGMTTLVRTGEAIFPEADPFTTVPPPNLLPTIFLDMVDGNGNVMPNTLPSTPERPYNLHPEPVVTPIERASPTDDLRTILRSLKAALDDREIDRRLAKRAVDIIEGNPVPDRAYSGFPLLHYTGPEQVKRVEPVLDDQGNVIGGNVDVHQIFYDNHIEADTIAVDPSEVLDVPWTVTYTVDVLNRGADDFSPFAVFFDDPALSPPGNPPLPHVGMDQTFFPMDDGTRNVFEIAMPPGKYLNLIYTWGWRIHPPRIQAIENARKTINGVSIQEHEAMVFGDAPTSSRRAQRRAIAQIGALSPAKRMWHAFRRIERTGSVRRAERALQRAESAFEDWQDRTRLPAGVAIDPDSDVTLLFVNNTIYGHARGMTDDSQATAPDWTLRGTTLKFKLLNGDYFTHAYSNIDFGGLRGWENLFQPTQAVGGTGYLFTFGRAHWWINAGATSVGLITVPPATRSERGDVVGEHRVEIEYNYEPSRRLRFYQFDPLHHNVAIWSVH
jgi:hypothetical protein